MVWVGDGVPGNAYIYTMYCGGSTKQWGTEEHRFREFQLHMGHRISGDTGGIFLKYLSESNSLACGEQIFNMVSLKTN